MIYVKFLFTGWKEVSKEQALNFAKHIYKSSSALHSKDKIKYINDNYIKGIEFTENENPIYYIKELKEIIDENYNRLKNIYDED